MNTYTRFSQEPIPAEIFLFDQMQAIQKWIKSNARVNMTGTQLRPVIKKWMAALERIWPHLNDQLIPNNDAIRKYIQNVLNPALAAIIAKPDSEITFDYLASMGESISSREAFWYNVNRAIDGLINVNTLNVEKKGSRYRRIGATSYGVTSGMSGQDQEEGDSNPRWFANSRLLGGAGRMSSREEEALIDQEDYEAALNQRGRGGQYTPSRPGYNQQQQQQQQQGRPGQGGQPYQQRPGQSMPSGVGMGGSGAGGLAPAPALNLSNTGNEITKNNYLNLDKRDRIEYINPIYSELKPIINGTNELFKGEAIGIFIGTINSTIGEMYKIIKLYSNDDDKFFKSLNEINDFIRNLEKNIINGQFDEALNKIKGSKLIKRGDYLNFTIFGVDVLTTNSWNQAKEKVTGEINRVSKNQYSSINALDFFNKKWGEIRGEILNKIVNEEDIENYLGDKITEGINNLNNTVDYLKNNNNLIDLLTIFNKNISNDIDSIIDKIEIFINTINDFENLDTLKSQVKQIENTIKNALNNIPNVDEIDKQKNALNYIVSKEDLDRMISESKDIGGDRVINAETILKVLNIRMKGNNANKKTILQIYCEIKGINIALKSMYGSKYNNQISHSRHGVKNIRSIKRIMIKEMLDIYDEITSN